MEWRDEGILLGARRHGESNAILDVFTANHGRHLGLLRGGGSPRRAADLQPGAQVAVTWRARLEEHLGEFRAETIRHRAARLLDQPLALAALRSAAALLTATLPERDAQPQLYPETLALFDALHDAALWPGLYAAWELTLLEALGFGLDLSACAATGQTQELIYVSPRSGRAVSRGAGAPYADRLLPLPAFLRLGGPADPAEFASALRTTGHFIARHAPDTMAHASGSPPARLRLQTLADKFASSPET